MKRIILIAAVVLTLAACNNATSTNTDASHEGENTSTVTDSVKGVTAVTKDTTAKAETVTSNTVNPDHAAQPITKNTSFDDLYSAYFDLKDALARDNGQAAQQAAKKMEAVIAKVEVTKLEAASAATWKQYQRKLAFDTEHIAGIDENGHQREHFVTLSKNMYALMKAAKPETPVYHQHCPMYNEGKGAYWLSKQKAIDNPYLGKSMPTCGSTVETI